MEEITHTISFTDSPASLAYYHQGNSTGEKGLTLPLLQSELMFRLAGDFSVELSSGTMTNLDTVFFGLFTQPMAATVVGPFAVAGIFLQPYGFYQLTGSSLHALRNQAVDAREIWGEKVLFLRDRLLATAEPNTRLDLLRIFIEGLPLHLLHPRVQKALIWLKQAEGGQDLVFRLAKTLGVSEKTVHADFKREIGLSPVVYQLLSRFQESLPLLQQPDFSLSTLAHELDYYDQAHFIKRFSAFAGMTPGNYRKSRQNPDDTQSAHYIPLR